jgi:hypothetical protein
MIAATEFSVFFAREGGALKPQRYEIGAVDPTSLADQFKTAPRPVFPYVMPPTGD